MKQFVYALRAIKCAAALVLVLTLNSVCSAALVLHIDDGANRLGTVDVQTGAVNVIGGMGNDTMTDIAFDPNGNLYGVSFSRLYRINPTTAQVTLVGDLGFIDQNALVFGSDGTLYSAGFNSQNLYSINTTTGAATSLGNIGFSSAGDLAFNGGSLYMSSTSNQLIRISLTPTLTASPVGSFGFSNVFGLATGSDGVLYGVSGTTIFSVNTTTGAGTFVSNYGGNGLIGANGTSFFTEAQPVPEPATLTMFGLAAIGMGFGAIRRRKAA